MKTCYIRVTVRSIHKMLFPFAPAFAQNVPLKSAFIMPLRSSLSRGTGAPPAVPTNCTVPDFVNKKQNAADSLWSLAGFTGILTKTGPNGNWTINGQDVQAGLSVPCGKSMGIWN